MSAPCFPAALLVPALTLAACGGGAMATSEQTVTERVISDRERYVARGVNTPPLVVARAEGARIEDVDGRTYIDFAGGLGCQNLGHGYPPAVEAMREQLDRYLHQC